MTPNEERILELDIIVTTLDRRLKLVTGHVINGEQELK
jgi:hypothetical protein